MLLETLWKENGGRKKKSRQFDPCFIKAEQLQLFTNKITTSSKNQQSYSLSISTNCEWFSGDLLWVLLKWSLTAWLLANVRLQSLHLNFESDSSSVIWESVGRALSAFESSGSFILVGCSMGNLFMSLIWKPRWFSRWDINPEGVLNCDAQSLQ